MPQMAMHISKISPYLQVPLLPVVIQNVLVLLDPFFPAFRQIPDAFILAVVIPEQHDLLLLLYGDDGFLGDGPLSLHHRDLHLYLHLGLHQPGIDRTPL